MYSVTENEMNAHCSYKKKAMWRSTYFGIVLFATCCGSYRAYAACCRIPLDDDIDTTGDVSACVLLDPCVPPGQNEGDRKESCERRGCYYDINAVCDYECRTDSIPYHAHGASEEVTGWSSSLRRTFKGGEKVEDSERRSEGE